MKFIHQLGAAAMAAIMISPLAAAPFQFNDGDLVLGVQASGGTGASRNVFFNLGPGTELRDNPDKGQIGNIGATLTKVFGANWFSRADLYFGVIGNRSAASPSGIFSEPPVNGDPARTFYVSQPADSPGAGILYPAGTFVSSALGAAGTKFSGMETMLVGTAATPGLELEADKAAILDQTAQPVEWNNSWSIWNPSLGLGQGPAFDTFNGGIQQNFGKAGAAAYVDIQRILATNTGAKPTGVDGGGAYQTTIAITSSGSVIAQTTPVVSAPEIDVQQPAGKPLADGVSAVNFGKVEKGKSGTPVVFAIVNQGNAPLNKLALSAVGSHAADFKFTALSATTLAPGASATFSVTFKPGGVGSRTATLRVVSNDANKNPFDIKLAGTGLAGAPEIEVFQPATAALIDGRSKKSFGTVRLGKSGISKVFTIKNTGGATLSRLQVSKAGSHSKDFIITQPKKTSLAPGASTTFAVNFKPTARGTRSAALRIRSNDANENPFDIGLSGLGAR